MKFGRLLEILSGHEGPVTSLQFSPTLSSTTLVSGSWDKSIKIWNCVESSTEHETIDILSDVTAVAFKPNGEEVTSLKDREQHCYYSFHYIDCCGLNQR